MTLEKLTTDDDKSCEQLELLTTILQEFSTSLDINTTMQHVTQLVKKYLDAEGVSLFLLDDKQQTLTCQVCASDHDITGISIAADEGIAGKSLRENKTFMIRDATKDPDYCHNVDNTSGSQTRSLLCAPLTLKDRKLGVMEAINKQTGDRLFDEHDRNLFTILANTAAMAIHNAQMADDLIFQERTRRELELAREIQAALLPTNVTDYPVYGLNIPARMVSGDFYDHFLLDNGCVCFCLGDVSGKGLNASLMMAKTTSLFRCLGKRLDSPGALLSVINDEIFATATHGMFVTMVAGVYDPAKQRITMVNAGHHSPLLLTNEGDFKELDTATIPLGIMPDITFEVYEVNLDGGELYIFTDGLSECWFKRDKQLGLEGVKALIKQFSDTAPTERLNSIVQTATHWKREETGYLFDDVTMLLVTNRRPPDE